jgi:hypothetical protein
MFKHVVLKVHYRAYSPTLAAEVAGVAGALVGRVTNEVGVVVERTLIDGQELMAVNIGVV